MSLIDMCNRVLAEVGYPTLNAVAANEDGTAKQVLAISNTELRALSQAFDWPHLETDYEFPTVVGQEQYAWPADFRKLSFGSVFDTDQYYGLRGSMNIEQWNKYKHGLIGSVSHQRFRQVYVAGAPTIELAPAPSQVLTLVGVYYSDEYARTSGGASQALYSIDSDVSKVPEELVELGVKWRFRRAKGLDFSAELVEYQTTIRQQFAGYKALGDIMVGGPRTPLYDGLTQGYVPDNGFGV